MAFENWLHRIGEAFSGRAVPVPVPPGHAVSIPDHDAEPEQPKEQGAEVVPLALFIRYVDAAGYTSERRILCKRFDPIDGRITAICLEQQALRIFRIDRIALAVCPVTGEVFDAHQIAEGLLARGIGRDDRLTYMLTILVYLMRCDRFATVEEFEAIERAVTAWVLRTDAHESVVTASMRTAYGLAPDDRDFVKALRWIALRPDRAQIAAFLRHWSHQVIAADGVITIEEVSADAAIDEALRHLCA